MIFFKKLKKKKKAFLICATCPKFNPRKPTHTNPTHFNWPNRPFKVWQIDFIQLPTSHGYTYVLVMVCMFSHWLEAFFCRQNTASVVAKFLLEKVIPTWRIPLKLHNNWETHFTGHVIRISMFNLVNLTALPLSLPPPIVWPSRMNK